MNNPKEFIIRTGNVYENNESLMHNQVIDLLKSIGYKIEEQGIDNDKKYYWKFKLLSPIPK